MPPKQQYESALAGWKGRGDCVDWCNDHAENLLAIAAASFAPVVTDAMVERATKAVFACYFAEDEPQDIILEKWHKWLEERENAERLAKAALTAALQENGQ